MPRGNQKGGGGNNGRGGRGGGHNGRGGKASVASRESIHVAKPGVQELPSSLLLQPSSGPVPLLFQTAFPEFRKQQPFFSALEQVFPEFSGAADRINSCWMGISGELIRDIKRHEYSQFSIELDVSGVQEHVFLKRIHLLDPIAAMEGEYVWPEEGGLPAPSDLWKTALAKINNPLNEAYVDALFALVASKFVESGLSPHWCRCFGTFSARADTYMYNITDEYPSMRRKPWWNRNQRLGLFKFHANEEPASTAFLTEGITDLDTEEFESLEEEGNVIVPTTVSPISPTTSAKDSPKGSAAGSRSSRASRHTGDNDSDDTEFEQFAEFSNFPVQVTLLEHAEGTMDELLDDEDEDDETLAETKEARWAAWLFQVIAALTEAQHYFGFVHNDLHSNNIMWSGTGQTHLYYRVNKGKEAFYMKVPTYGRIMKIIDFGRASYHLPDPAGFFISDAFFPGNDAAEQYNCEPFYDEKEGKRIEPNRSFDLARLSISMIESLYQDRPATTTPTRIMSKEPGKIYTETVSAVYNLLWEWLQDDEGRNILRLPDGEERYPDFDLYKALAADVHRAIPSKQIEKALFSGYRCTKEDIPAEERVYDLHI